ncbi:MAG: hypothetical protein JXB15_02085 [Anaerolineales bacterium]|nr:hypothetical protein [Anaerolineales bacterium]
MKTVRIIKSWSWPDLLRQTPGGRGRWDDLQFILDESGACDYALVLNHPRGETRVTCPPHHIWALIQEPPNEIYQRYHRGRPEYARVYTTDPMLEGPRYWHTQPALPWHINRDYDTLIKCQPPTKERQLSWITSNLVTTAGQRQRLRFLERIRPRVSFDLYGKGFHYLEDKWDGLAPYRYSLVVENFRNPYYWSEKLADCFLSWTMPIYYGCTRIQDYFPAEAMQLIDIQDEHVIERLQEIISGDAWQRSLEAVAYARRLVLERYQFFPLIASEIEQHEARGCSALTEPAREIILRHEVPGAENMSESLQDLWRRLTPVGLRQRIARLRQKFEG